MTWSSCGVLLVGTAFAAPGSSAAQRLRAELAPGGTEGVSPGRSGQSQVALPKTLQLAWRAHVSFGILELLVAHDGRLVATTPNQELVELDRKGQRLGAVLLPGVPTRACILADGTRVVATDRGQLLGFDARGVARFVVEPGWTRLGEPIHLLPLPLGGFAAASLRRVAVYGSDGSTRSATTVDEAVEGLVFTGNDLAVVLRSGVVLRWSGREPPRSLGDFGAPLESRPIVQDGKLVALTASAAVAKDPTSGRNHSFATGLDIAPDTAPFVLGKQLAWLGANNALIRLDWNRGATQLPLGPETTARASDVRPVSDRGGNVALLNALGELALVGSQGQVITDTEVRCVAPVALLPQGEARLVLACRTGAIWAFGP